MTNEKIIEHWKQKLANAKTAVEKKIAEERLESYLGSPTTIADKENDKSVQTVLVESESPVMESTLVLSDLIAERDKMQQMVQKHPHLQTIIDSLDIQIAKIEESNRAPYTKWAYAKDVGPLTFIFDYKGEVMRTTVDWDAYSDFKPLFDDFLILDRAVEKEIASSKCYFTNITDVLQARAMVIDTLVVSQQYRVIHESIMKKAKEMNIEGEIIC
ncbi:MAG: hypothetical protein M9949_14260 [Candidatus Kapabacteria bacterium]|nr:hypothetical protein [Candidatus Kapabacteria bacterium]